MSSGSYDTKEQIRQAVDIVDLVGSYLQLRREGRGFKALCPWHDDSRPSLQINPERQSFKCWVCDVGGDIFSFVMKMENIDFRGALEMLADRAGVRLTAPQAGGGQANPLDDKRVLYKAMAWADEQFHHCLMQSNEAAGARQYLIERHITDESVRRFQLGFAPDQWDWLSERARKSEFNPRVMERVGLISRRQQGPGYYDRFKGRVLFPIFDLQNRAVGIGGRVLPGSTAETAKYVNSPETPLFTKSKHLYGLNLARDAIRKSKTALVMEGYTDCIVAHQCGFDNAVAVLGTALGLPQIRLLKQCAGDLRIILVLDGDEAGRKRANEVLELFVAERVDLRVLTLPGEADPCEFLLERGADEFRRLTETADDALTHAVRTATAGIDLQRDLHASSQALEKLVATIAKAPRPTADDEHLREQRFLSSLARSFRLPEEQLRASMEQLRKQSPRPRAVVAEPVITTPIARIDPHERELLEILLQFPDALARCQGLVEPQHFGSDACRAIYIQCRQLAASGIAADFARLLLEIDDPQVKNLLVALDESGRSKGSSDASARIDDVLAGFQRRRQEPWRRAQTAALNEGKLKEDEELAILLQIAKQERIRQGISEPMDGQDARSADRR